MRILNVTPNLPWPIDSGGNAAQFSTLAALSEDHDFDVVCPINSLQQLNAAKELNRRLPRVEVIPVKMGSPQRYLPGGSMGKHAGITKLVYGLAEKPRKLFAAQCQST